MTTTIPAFEPKPIESRSAALPTAEPIRLMFDIAGIEFAPAVDWLVEGEAGFDSSPHFDLFYEGQMIGPAVLSLEDEGMTVVYPVVKSKNWPGIRVEFMGLSEKDRQMIRVFLTTKTPRH